MTSKRGIEVSKSYPLSFLQEGMLFHSLGVGIAGQDIEQIVATLERTIDPDIFRRAWCSIVARHDLLRTRLRWEGIEKPEQEVLGTLKDSIVEEDWSSLDDDQRTARLDSFLNQDRQRGFDLREAPLWRMTLIRSGAEKSIFIWTFHHVLLDGRSFRTLLNELFITYDAHLKRLNVSLPDPVAYDSYINWLHRQDFTRSKKFWSDALEGFTAPTPLPFPTSRESCSRRREQEIHFSTECTDKLRHFAQAHHLTLNTLVQGAWAILLHRYSGESDVVFGGVRACRKSCFPDAEHIVGLLINTVPVRTRLEPDTTLLELLKKLRHDWIAQRDHEHTPLVNIQAWSSVPPGMSLFHSILMFENSGLNDSLRGTESMETKANFRLIEQPSFPLTLNAYAGRALCLRLLTGQGGFDDATLFRILGHLQRLLEAMPEKVSEPIIHLSLLSPVERDEMIRRGARRKEFDATVSLHEWFEAQVGKSPQSPAVTYEGQTITYEELNRRANQLAHHLKALGVGPETLVALCVSRSMELVVGILGILKAGGGYLPIDPACPPDRVAYMVEDAQAKVLVTQRSFGDLPTAIPVIVYLDDNESLSKQTTNPVGGSKPENVAYVIYTSGSTGKPKGVTVTHHNVVRLFAATEAWFGFNQHDVWTLFHSAAFDFSVWEIFGALLYGGRLVVVPYLVSRSSESFHDLLQREKVTVLNQTPSAFKQLIEVDSRAPNCSTNLLGTKDEHTATGLPTGTSLSLRYVVFGGEALDPQSLRPWFDRHGDECPKLINMYGITETTVHVTYRPLSKNDLCSRSAIGEPIPDLEIYILDQHREPVPVGVPGEIYVGGSGVARGYLNRPELTGERFILDPFHAVKEGSASGIRRLYRTGDLARFLPGRDIEYLGRIDQQLKIRGFRIELGEIESVLRTHPTVREATVVVRNHQSDDRRLVAYVVPKYVNLSSREIRTFLRGKLPEYMIPSAFVVLDKLPLTSNGKLDTKALPAPQPAPNVERFAPPQTEVQRNIAKIWQEVIGTDNVGLYDNFFDLGGHSLLMVRLQQRLNSFLQREISMTTLFQFPTIDSFSGWLAESRDCGIGHKPVERNQHASVEGGETKKVNRVQAIAIVGMAGRFPGARNVDQFWENLKNGVESVSFFQDEELVAEGVDRELLANPTYVKARSVLDDVDLFDASFFGFNPKQAEAMDPQHRIFLETAWEALENAGYDSEQFRGSIGVYAGLYMNTYLLNNLCTNRPFIEDLLGFKKAGAFQTFLGNDKDYLTTRLAYKMNLRGPAITMQTACSTSLVAVCQACAALLSYHCDMALAGGVTITSPQKKGYLYAEGGMLSPDGHCRAFDAKAQGTVFGSGIGLVVLKRLEEAVADGDNILAVIKGSALNNDGSQKVSYTAPSVDGQSEAIARAHAAAGVTADTITYVEAHGTGTPMGDPIEIAGLTQAFRTTTTKNNYCAIGAVKTNIGHLDVAAGVAGLIKTTLALKHKQIPPTLHFSLPNPKIDFSSSPFYVNHKLNDWVVNGIRRRAGVSSFGVGGTNAHVVLEEAPSIEPASNGRKLQLLLVSARTPTALDAATRNLASHFLNTPDVNLADAAFTLQVGRKGFNHRRLLVCDSVGDAIPVLESLDAKRVITGKTEHRNPAIIFMFPGQGSQYVNMGRELYEIEAVFRNEVNRCAEILQPLLGGDLREVIYKKDNSRNTAFDLTQTRFAQPAIFTIEYALAQLWMSWGIRPTAMVGHSVGEYVAGCIAEVFSLEDALTLVAHRASLVQEQPGGAMLAVRLSEKQLQPLLPKELSIAAINSPSLTVVAGPYDAIDAFEKMLKENGTPGVRLNTSHAFHSSMMDPVLPAFTELLRKVKLQEPKIPYLSNVTAQWISPDEATAPEYWAGHVRQAVRFADALSEICKDSQRILLEVGPGQTLTTLARQHPAKQKNQVILASLPTNKDGSGELGGILNALGRLWLAGTQPDWSGFYRDERRLRIAMPTYPFERKRYWIEPQHDSGFVATNENLSSSRRDIPHPLPQKIKSTTLSMKTKVPSDRRPRITKELREQLHEMSGVDLNDSHDSASFTELGFDSLFLTQARVAFEKKFGIKVTSRQLQEDLCTVKALAEFIDEQLTTEPEPQESPMPVSSVAVSAPALANNSTAGNGNSMPALASAFSSGSALEQIVAQQLQLMSQQMAALQKANAPMAVAATVPDSPRALDSSNTASVRSTGTGVKAPKISNYVEAKPFGPYRPVNKAADGGLTEKQQRYLNQLIERYCARTKKSKEYAQRFRASLADPRNVAGFRLLWKELVYQIVIERSEGSRLWDIDGNEYIDITMGFGVNLFGHRPAFVMKAIADQTDKGIHIAPQSPLTGEVAELFRELTGTERVTFCNTGSEAVMAAMRVARTVTGRDKIVFFSGDYHGMFDEVLLRSNAVNGKLKTVPISPGIPTSAGEQVWVLDYAAPESLEFIRKHAADIAAVLVEPVQSRNPDLQPREFLHELRKVTKETGSLLIFDEVIMGFRAHQGGAQAHFDVRADLATYGKIVGGGVPIGILAGKKEYLDTIDGGMWQFGDSSVPQADMTFFAGTFVRHPIALAAAKAVLTHLKQSGPSLQDDLNKRTSRFAKELNEFFERKQLPIHMMHFASLFRFHFANDLQLINLLFYQMVEKGVFIREAHQNCFLSTAHTDADLERVIQAVKESVEDLQAAELLPSIPDEKKSSVEIDGYSYPAEQPATPDSQKPFPLTDAQREIWIACQMGNNASCAYNESFTARLNGQLNVDALREAFSEVVKRHEALRTTFSADGEQQIVHPGLAGFEVPLIDLLNRRLNLVPTSDHASEKLAEILRKEAEDPFDLVKGPLLRTKLVKLSGHEHVLVFTAHHIICDGWSSTIVLNELSQLYLSKTLKSPRVLPTPMQFRDYAAWEKKQRESGETESYWLNQFAGHIPVLNLPTEKPRGAKRTFAGARVERILERDFTQKIKASAGKAGCTPFVYLLAAFKVLLARWSGQTDLVVGIPAAGQNIIGEETLVGHCANLLPLRSNFDHEQTFADFLKATRKLVLDAYDHQDYTFSRLIQKLNVPRDPTRVPLVQVTFNLDKPVAHLDFGGLETELAPTPRRRFNFDIGFNLVDEGGTIRIECDYNSECFGAETMRHFLDNYRSFLDYVSTDPSLLVKNVNLISEQERHRLLVEWNDTEVNYPKDKCVHELFEEQALLTPAAVAAKCGDHELTYGDLNRNANLLATKLQEMGIGPEKLVAVHASRSLEMIVGILATLKAGGAYVPIDSNYPPERLAFMLRDSKAAVLLTERTLLTHLPPTDAKVATLDCYSLPNPPGGAANLTTNVSQRNLAYVIYTSGSTGQPKGVMIEHGSLMNLVAWHVHEYQITRGDRATQIASPSFDAAVWEIWPYLTAGASIHIPSEEIRMEPMALASWLIKNQITFAFVPTPMAEILADESWPRAVALRAILTGGDKFRRHPKRSLPFKLVNHYGPTEYTVVTTYAEIQTQAEEASAPPIGRPIANTRLYILDQHLVPVPTGIPGELCIAGDGLARGYLNEPAMTNEKFIPDPFYPARNARLYKTGDCVRYRQDGQIEFIGRLDQQVKIRGFRVELGEIEAVLNSQEGVQQSAVILREDDPGQPRLVAYVEALLANGEAATSTSRLTKGLKAKLPDYMIPSAFVLLDTLPRNANGKLDRDALPAPVFETAGSVVPRTATEELVRNIWIEVLGVEEISVHDNFFELRGHSLLAMQVLSRIRQALQIELPIRSLFDQPTIAELSEVIDTLSRTAPKTFEEAAELSLR